MSDSSPQDLRFGPNLDAQGVTFFAWSPGARRLSLILHPKTRKEARVPYVRGRDGFWRCRVEEIGAPTRSLIQSDDHLPQPDPASPFQPEGVFGPSEIIDHGAYRLSTTPGQASPPRTSSSTKSTSAPFPPREPTTGF
ncbi:MAG: hypothetical protein KAI47_00320, partial [Deltaproteobacteria bacterium]|nr:hypothetical protein [Deltaproteobacteria bacterium]